MLFSNQCAVTKEIINNGDDVIVMILESSNFRDSSLHHLSGKVESTCSYFIPATLPVEATFYDGQVLAKHPCGMACELAFRVYGTNFTNMVSMDDQPFRFRNALLVESGTVKETNITFIMKKRAYEEILRSHKFSDFMREFQGEVFYRTLSSNFHTSLFCFMRDRNFSEAEITTLVEALCLFSGLRLLGYYFLPELLEVKETFGSLTQRLNFTKSVILDKDSNTLPNDVAAVWRCGISGSALAPGEFAHVMPISNNMFLDTTTEIEHILPTEINSLYGLVSPPCKIRVGDRGAFETVENLSDIFKGFLVAKDKANPKSNGILIEQMVNGGMTIKNDVNSSASQLTAMVISDEAYRYMMADFSPKELMSSFYHWEYLACRVRQLVDAKIFKRKDLTDRIEDSNYDSKILSRILSNSDNVVFSSMGEFKKYLLGCLVYESLVGDDEAWTFAKLMDVQYSGLSGITSSALYSKAKKIVFSESSSEAYELIDELGRFAHSMSPSVHLLQKFKRTNIMLRPSWLVHTNMSVKLSNSFNQRVRRSVFLGNDTIQALQNRLRSG